MSPFTREQFLQRVQGAVGLPILYWLGYGGCQDRVPTDPTPGTAIDPCAAFADKQRDDEAVASRYEQAMQALGLQWQDLPRSACDCSGFVTWALGLARQPDGPAGGWIYTDSIHADARGQQRLFQRADRPRTGTLLVFSKGGDHAVGHIAVVTQVDAQGRVTEITHCAPDNYLMEPAPGDPRSSIRRTPPTMFIENRATLAVEWRHYAP